MSKYYNKLRRRFQKYYDRIYSYLYVLFFHDEETIKRLENRKFEELGFDINSSLEKLNHLLQNKYNRNYNKYSDSIHWLVFSAISNQKHYRKILEIGTYDGEFTNMLGNLFPRSKITTVDLPKEDPLMASFYNRDESHLFQQYIEKQNNNTNSKKIKVIKSNTFFLLNAIGDNEKFDLIWVDGGHLYPDIAWDLCNAYHLLNEGGMLLCDDVIMLDKKYKTRYVSTESWEVLKYMEKRINNRATYLLKRLDSALYSSKYSRKYVAVLKK